jgi:small subunit ribosomal protein S9
MAKDAKTYYLGTGRRKTAVARVRVSEGKGEFSINGRSLDNYFREEKDRASAMGPLMATELAAKVDVIVKAHGGGITGQADAVRQGIARAVLVMFGPPTARKSVTVGNVTCVRSRNVQAKGGEAAPVGEVDENAIGITKKLRDGRFLTRDSRMKERKKYGLRGARRGTQFSKR